MTPVRRQSLIEQTAEHVRQEIRKGRLERHLPGVLALAKRFAVSKDTVRAAIHLLEKEGTLKAGGAGKRRSINPRRKRAGGERALRVAILLDDHLPFNNAHTQELMLSIQHTLEAAGHICVFGEKSLRQLNNLLQLARFVRATKADAWIVYSASREVLEWFAKRITPVLAIGGRAIGLPIAAAFTDVRRAMASAVDALANHGHRRIVLICDSLWRHPSLNLSAQSFLHALQRHGINLSEFNIPDWDATPEGFQRMMDSLFQATPPTALIIVEPSACVAARIFLAERGLSVSRDVSLVSILPDSVFSLHHPVIAHFEWITPAVVNRAAQWVKSVAQGNPDHKATFFHAKFNPGGTVAPVKK